MHQEVLTKRAAELFGSLSRFPGFYLAGGTALALQIGHRVSIDFDLFSDNDIERSLLPRVQRVFSDAASIAPLINNTGELTVLVDDVKITFLKYPFPTFDPFVIYEEVPLLSVREIAATKAYTIGRCPYKDYIDLYFILSERRHHRCHGEKVRLQIQFALVSGAARISTTGKIPTSSLSKPPSHEQTLSASSK
jgi:Nucleotidyl transferase AbiEii toxin, Type IV TA system